MTKGAHRAILVVIPFIVIDLWQDHEEAEERNLLAGALVCNLCF